MKRKWLSLGLLVVSTMISSAAAPLQFTNVTVALFSNLTSQLNAVVYGGSSNFLAVGAGQIYVCGNFTPMQPWFVSTNWATNSISSNSSRVGANLTAVASSGNLFVASGDNNWIFIATNIFSANVLGLNWQSNNAKVFNNNALAAGAAYNGTNFVIVGEAPEIGYTNLPAEASWQSAVLTDPSFAESFRAVTPFGANGFAACGIYADVRLSTDSAMTWQHVNGAIGQPALSGIAYDGTNTFVCVGTDASSRGIIMVSTNNGTNGSWQFVYTNGSSLNAVAYTGSGFVAVGNGGQFLSSTDGINNWINNQAVPIVANSNNLYGVAYAGKGLMTGISEMVGDKGTVILAGTPPLPPTNLGNQTNCATDSTNIPAVIPINPHLVVSINTDADHPLGSLTVDWFDWQMKPVTNGLSTTNIVTLDDKPFDDNTPSNYVYHAQTRDLRTGFTSPLTSVTLTINPRPKAKLLSFISTDCNEGPVYTLTNTLTGIGPWVVTWNDGLVQTNTSTGTGPAILTRTVYPTNSFRANSASNNVYFVTMVSNADMCSGNLAGDITGVVTNTINPRPTAALLSFISTDCNEGAFYTLTNTLTGIGPWVVTWNDGLVQTNASLGAGPVTLARTVHPTNSFGVNLASNNVYYVTAVVDGTLCAGDHSGDITGVVTNTINPRPTAALLSFISTDCNEGAFYTLTNTLTGIGPWVVTWNDGLVQTNASVGAGPVTLARTVYPTNSFGVNLASNNVYYVTGVVDGTLCAGDHSGDITGVVTNTINPRPTAALLSFISTDCNEGAFYTLTNTLTGIGPWVVTWNDGLVQTNASIGAGPVTLARTVYPTNSFGAETASNNVYYVTGVVDGTLCAGDHSGDITGAVTNTINPRPTAALLSFISTDCNEGAFYTLTNTLTGIGPWVVTWNDGLVQTNASLGAGPVTLARTVHPTNSFGVNLASNNVYYVTAVVDGTLCAGDHSGDITGVVTNTINPRPTAALLSFISTDCNEGAFYTLTNTLTGIGPWVVTWNDGLVQTNASVGAGPVTLARTVHPTNSFGVNLASNNVYYVTGVVDGTLCAGDHSGDITGAVTNTINPTPLAPFAPNMAGVVTNSAGDILETNVLGGVALLAVAVQPNYTAWWFDWTQTHVLTNNSLVYLPTNAICGVYTNYVQAQDTNTGCFSKDYAKVILVLVPPAPTSNGGQTNCAGVANPPLSVTVFTNFDNPTNLTANWYTHVGTLVATHSLTFVPTDTAPGTHTYWVEAQDFASGLVSTNRTQVNLILQSCANPPAISFDGANGAVQWFGNLKLQSTTNLVPPVVWQDVFTNGTMGTNIWYWTNGVPPWTNQYYFFRLFTN